MSQPISFDLDTCTACGICSLVCPCGTIAYEKGEKPTVNEKARCMGCGQCDAFCPMHAVSCDFPGDYPVHNYDDVADVTPKQLAKYLQKRRSIRSYKNAPVPKETMNEIFDIVRYAPTGGNFQSIHWVVLSGEEKLNKLTKLVIEWFRGFLENAPETPYTPVFKGLVAAYDAGHNVITWGAPHLVSVATDEQAISGDADGIIAMSWFEIALNSFGLGCVWLGLVKMAAMQSPEVAALLKLPEGTKLQYTMIFGEPKLKVHKIPKRRPAKVYWR